MKKITFIISALILISCSKDNEEASIEYPNLYPSIATTFGDNLDLNNLLNYENQEIPFYITKDNGTLNTIDNKTATLGRVLFYDKNLSVNNTISCASCHKQELAFSDNEVQSIGVNGVTNRHSMRLVNNRFANEVHYFWDERATSLEMQTTMPIKDHGEMGFSGINGDPSFDDLLVKLSAIDYYQELFSFVYGSSEITENKMQKALAQFVRSIQSFDSKYDIGRAQVNSDNKLFPNFSPLENEGKNLFLAPITLDANSSRISGGLGCNACHNAPEFDIDPLSLNNGIVGTNGQPDFANTKSPSLRNLLDVNGELNGQLMHNGFITNLDNLLTHYNNMTSAAMFSSNLDPRLMPNGIGLKLNITSQEREALKAFLGTLTGVDVYTNEKWSNPFPN